MVAAGVVAAVVALAVVWRATGAGAWTDPERIHEMLRALGDSPWAIPAVWGVFVVATLVMVPINALFVAVGLTFGFVQALALSMSGALLATGVIDWIGRRFDVDPLLARAPDWVRRLKRRRLERAGVLQLTAMRLLPLGPFATVNLIWALSEPIPWKAEACRRAGTVHLGGTLEEIVDSEAAVWKGRVHRLPFVLLAQPQQILAELHLGG